MAFHVLEQSNRLVDGYKRTFRIEGKSLLLIQEHGEVFLIENRCPHMDAPLDTGTVTPDAAIRCRAHGIEFDLRSGRASGSMANMLDCLNRFNLIYEGTAVGVDL
jgi:nitrite reductase/ring-hydroxylating ferredoxin subunit